VNLFVLGHASHGTAGATEAETALKRLLEPLPFFPARPVESWRAPSGTLAAAWVTHASEQVGGVRYVHAEDGRLALFSGRPFRWSGERAADGRAPLDPAFYLPPAETWAGELDGRFAAARYDDADRTLEVVSDSTGAYPVYEATTGATRWISNNAELLRGLCGSTELDPEVLAPVLGGGWSLSGHPAWRGVRRLSYGCIRRIAPGGPARRLDLLPVPSIADMLGAGFDPERAAELLAERRAKGPPAPRRKRAPRS
jgi:hypothetical protein